MSVILEVETNHGKRSIICDNFAYRIDHYLQGGNISWRCTHKTCKARIRTNGILTEVLQRKNEHNHEADERKLERQILRARSKRKAVEDLNEKLSNIVWSELENVDKGFLHPEDLKNVTKAMSRLRRKLALRRKGLNGIQIKSNKSRASVEENSPELSTVIKVEPVDADELLENNRGLEVSFCGKHDADSRGRAESSGSNSQECSPQKGQRNVDILELLQGARQRFETQETDRVPAVRDAAPAVHTTQSAHTSDVPTAKSLPDDKGQVLEELFKNALVHHNRQQKAVIRTENQTTAPLSEASAHSLHGCGDAGTEAPVGVTDPYSLLASGGMTVQELEQRHRHPFRFRPLEPGTRQGENTAHQQQEEGGNSALMAEQEVSNTTLTRLEEVDEICQEIPPVEPAAMPKGTLRLMTPSDFEKPAYLSSRLRMDAVGGRNVSGRHDRLMTPQDFMSGLRPASSAPNLSRLYLSEPLSPPCPEMEPLTREQFQQTMIHMMRTDEAFLSSLHRAYLDSFEQVRSRASDR